MPASADELQVRELIAALAFEGDRGELERYGALLAEACAIESPAGTSEGRASILATAAERRAGGTVGPTSGTRHVVVPGIVTVDGDRAQARSSFIFFAAAAGGPPSVAAIGEYHDELERTGGTWLLARRRISFG